MVDAQLMLGDGLNSDYYHTQMYFSAIIITTS